MTSVNNSIVILKYIETCYAYNEKKSSAYFIKIEYNRK